MRSGEKISIKFLKAFNKLGLLKSLKPLLVKDLAKKIIDEALANNEDVITTYKF